MRSAAIFIAAILSSLVLQGAEMPKPLLALPLDEGTGTVLKESSGNDCRTQLENPELTEWVDGPAGKALKFNNADGPVKRGTVGVRVPAGWDPAKGFSMLVTVKTAPDLKQRRIYPLLRFSDAMFNGRGTSLFINWGMLWFRLGVDGKHGDVQTKTADVPMIGDSWYKIAAVYDGKVGKLYVNGKLVAEKELPVQAPKYHKDMLIGSSGGSGAGYGFDGVICDVRLFDRALTAEQVAALALTAEE